MTVFILWNIKEDILKNVGNQAVSVPIDFHYMDKNTMDVKRVTNIPKDILFYVLQKTEMDRGLEQHEGEYIMTEFSFLGGLSL